MIILQTASDQTHKSPDTQFFLIYFEINLNLYITSNFTNFIVISYLHLLCDACVGDYAR